jgi:ATP-binding cassette, subfamily B, bacterial PglK
MIHQKLKILFEKKQNIKILILLFAGMFATFFELVSIGSIPAFVMIIVDVNSFKSILSSYISLDFLSGINNRSITIVAASILTFIFLIKNIYLFLIIYFQGKILKDLRFSTSVKLFKYYINMPYIDHLSVNPAILIRTIESDVGLAFTYITHNITLIRESLILLSLFILLLVADPLISSFALLFLGIPVLIFYFFYRNKLKFKGAHLQKLIGKKIKTINHSLGIIKETKLLKRENFFLKSFFEINDKAEKINFLSYLMTSTPRLFLEVIALSAVVIVCALLVFIGRSPESIIPIVSLFAISAVRLIPGLNTITASLATIRLRKPSFDLIIQEAEKLNSSIKIKNFKNINNKDRIEFNNEISLKNLSFNYKTENKIAINNITMNIKKGTSVGIIGRSGSGKSTLVDIILGLLEPEKGEIFVDGVNIKYNKHSWQSYIGYIPQDIYLLDDTIKNNITFGINNNNINKKLLSESIKIAQLEKFIESSKNKIDTVVGNRGIRISGGEKQRIGIARALYNNPEILILDEATSALDIDNENKMLDEIYEGIDNKTLIVVSHRNNTVKHCDLIYVMEHGKIIDQGPYTKIMERNQYLKENKSNH